ncbi:MAG: UDP-N-acetylmuramate dehydrogenase [Bacteroidales bacterium]|nr:UDP-N-acetylmuramate dehydrogenase [Bacteroidales bacterium]
MLIKENFPLKQFNTFGIDVKAKYFVELKNDDEIVSFISKGFWRDKKFLILNGGSNILFTKDFDGVVMKIITRGIELKDETEESTLVKAKAGENWHQFVCWCISANLGGLENLSLIPGNVGAAPIQNIGAYGVEQKDVFESLEALEMNSCKIITFNRKECKFGYRSSIFKKELKNKYIILSVTYRLSKKPVFNTGYGDIQRELAGAGDKELTLKKISDAICRIRSSKLPDPVKIGSAGSFFKNPAISREKYIDLLKKYPGLPGYPGEKGGYKIPAGWMIDHLGWKGFRHGDAGVCATQALVLVNYGHADGSEILKLAQKIQESVETEFGIILEPEVNIY